jgi:hypothetical protein
MRLRRRRPDGNLVAHAKRELALIGEDQDVIDWYVTVIRAFASYGHSGGSAMVTIPVLNELLQFRNLSPLTADPAEWIDHTGISGTPMWQNRRCSEAFSEDGGKTYYLLSEREAGGSMETTPLHHSVPADA